MKARDVDILILPGYMGGSSDHWYNRWVQKMPTARRVEQASWTQPRLADWVGELSREAALNQERPTVLVAHSLGCILAAHAAPVVEAHGVIGAFLVAPPSEKSLKEAEFAEHLSSFLPIPRLPFPFPVQVVASTNDPYCELEDAADLANSWGAAFRNHGESGHINDESGHGPWPEGVMAFARFLSILG